MGSFTNSSSPCSSFSIFEAACVNLHSTTGWMAVNSSCIFAFIWLFRSTVTLIAAIENKGTTSNILIIVIWFKSFLLGEPISKTPTRVSSKYKGITIKLLNPAPIKDFSTSVGFSILSKSFIINGILSSMAFSYIELL